MKITKQIKQALIDHYQNRIAILEPIFEDDDTNRINVLKVIDTNLNTTNFNGRLQYSIHTDKFYWHFSIGKWHKLSKNKYYFKTEKTIYKECRCIPIQLTEDIGKTLKIDYLG